MSETTDMVTETVQPKTEPESQTETNGTPNENLNNSQSEDDGQQVCKKPKLEDISPPPSVEHMDVETVDINSSPIAEKPAPVTEDSNQVSRKLELNETTPPASEEKKPEENGCLSLVDSCDEDADDPGTPDSGVHPDPPKTVDTTDSKVVDDSASSSPAVPATPSGEDDSNAVKKNDDDDDFDASVYRSVLRTIRADSFDNFTSSDLEELIVQKICESITERAIFGELRRRADTCEEELYKWKMRALDCQRQILELKEMLDKVLSELSDKKKTVIVPKRVCRSVGLQVSFNTSIKPRRVGLAPAIGERMEIVEQRQKAPPMKNFSKSFVNIKPKPAIKLVNNSTQPAYRSPQSSPAANNSNSKKEANLSVINIKSAFNSQVVDLTDDEPERKRKPTGTGTLVARPPPASHPAPMPVTPTTNSHSEPSWKPLPPRPELKLSSSTSGIILSWDMPDALYAKVAKYQLFAYQETSDAPKASLWRLIGEVKALSLPMACTLQSFVAGFRYHFAVRAVDIHDRHGQFSYPGSILLKPNTISNHSNVT